MIIIIDGYNFLKSITGTKFIGDQVMRDWMTRFQEYMYHRGNKVIVAFDGGPSYYPCTDWYGSVEVMYAGQDQTADDIIKKWLSKNRGFDILLVSSDREIRSWAESLRIASISSQDFNRVFNDVVTRQERQINHFLQTMHKTKDDDDSDERLDALMELGSRNLVSGPIKKEDEHSVRIRCNKKASKVDKTAMKKINKI